MDKNKKQTTNKFSKKKSPKLKTAYDIYRDAAITMGPYTGIPSIAARHTAIEYGSIQLDVGHTPREVGMNKLLVLITHFHADHGSDICNCIGYDDKVTVFVPAYCAFNLFLKIKCDISMQKGRQYSDDEIVKMVRIIGCKRNNGEFKDQTLILSQNNPDLVVAELINIGDIVPIQLRGRDQVAIEPFACYHTVDTCGYIIYDLRKRLSDVITLEPGFFVDVNFTEDQTVRKKRKHKQDNTSTSDQTSMSTSTSTTTSISVLPPAMISDPLKSAVISDSVSASNGIDQITISSPESVDTYDWKIDPRYEDVIGFSQKHNIDMYPEMIDKVITPTFTLKVRRLYFPNGMKITTKNDKDECTLKGDDFEFLKKYKININIDHLTPKTMFFGDTCSYVFNPASVGFSRVSELLEKVETVIIESTFLESREEMGDSKYKDRLDKRHMFLFDLYDVFKKYPKTQFLLIHFSACYDRTTIKSYIDKTQHTYGNVKAFI